MVIFGANQEDKANENELWILKEIKEGKKKKITILIFATHEWRPFILISKT